MEDCIFCKLARDEIHREIIYENLAQKIFQTKINFWPFWVKKAPKNLEKINIKLNLE